MTNVSSLGLAFAILATILGLALLYDGENASAWVATHWLFTYEHGVVKRGLVGTLSLVSSSVSVNVVSLWAIAFATALLSAGLWVVLRSTSNTVAAMALVSFVLTSPGIVQQWLEDIGRFDVFGFILLCLACVFALRGQTGIGLLAVWMFSATAILIHEAFFFWVAPMSLGIWVWKHGVTRHAVGCALLLTGLTAWISLSSYAGTFAYDDAKALLQSQAEFAVNDNSLRVHYRGLIENMEYTAERAWVTERWLPLALGTGYLCAMLLFIWPLLKCETHAIIILASFAPLMLFLLGHDQGRWFAMINANLLLALLVCLYVQPVRLKMSHAVFLSLGTVANLTFGPFGITQAFPALTL